MLELLQSEVIFNFIKNVTISINPLSVNSVNLLSMVEIFTTGMWNGGCISRAGLMYCDFGTIFKFNIMFVLIR